MKLLSEPGILSLFFYTHSSVTDRGMPRIFLPRDHCKIVTNLLYILPVLQDPLVPIGVLHTGAQVPHSTE